MGFKGEKRGFGNLPGTYRVAQPKFRRSLFLIENQKGEGGGVEGKAKQVGRKTKPFVGEKRTNDQAKRKALSFSGRKNSANAKREESNK